MTARSMASTRGFNQDRNQERSDVHEIQPVLFMMT